MIGGEGGSNKKEKEKMTSNGIDFLNATTRVWGPPFSFFFFLFFPQYFRASQWILKWARARESKRTSKQAKRDRRQGRGEKKGKREKERDGLKECGGDGAQCVKRKDRRRVE